jgi:hypothetical protein
MSTAATQIPQRCTLDEFVREVSNTGGLSVHALQPLTTVLVDTRNSVYRIILLPGGHSRILIQGGQFFPDFVEAHLAGSSFGGSFLKTGWIGVGLHLEIHSAGTCIVTSRIHSVNVQQDASLPEPH